MTSTRKPAVGARPTRAAHARAEDDARRIEHVQKSIEAIQNDLASIGAVGTGASILHDDQGLLDDPTGRGPSRESSVRGGVPGCGAYTQPRNGKGDAYTYCNQCHPGVIEPMWTRGLVIDAMRQWRERYERLPSSYDWSRGQANRRGGIALRRLNERAWPPASIVGKLFGELAGGSGRRGDPGLWVAWLNVRRVRRGPGDRALSGPMPQPKDHGGNHPEGVARSSRFSRLACLATGSWFRPRWQAAAPFAQLGGSRNHR